mgnify:CR=1 FL=1
MPTTAQEIYIQVVRTLSTTERLRLATLILNELSNQNVSVVEQSDTWSEEDRLDFTNLFLAICSYTFPRESGNRTRSSFDYELDHASNHAKLRILRLKVDRPPRIPNYK